MSATNPITGDDIKSKLGDVKKYRDGFGKIKPRNCDVDKPEYPCDNCNCWMYNKPKRGE